MTQYSDNWMQTYSGKRIDYLKVRPEDICLEDIACGLAHTNRYSGQTVFPYSVAQHSLLVAENVPPEHAFRALLHDASEAYLCDIPRPLKRLLPEYKKIEERFEAVIAERFGLTGPLKNEFISDIDNRILLDEKLRLFHSLPHRWQVDDLEPVDVVIFEIRTADVRHRYHTRFGEYRALREDAVLRGVSC